MAVRKGSQARGWMRTRSRRARIAALAAVVAAGGAVVALRPDAAPQSRLGRAAGSLSPEATSAPAPPAADGSVVTSPGAAAPETAATPVPAPGATTTTAASRPSPAPPAAPGAGTRTPVAGKTKVTTAPTAPGAIEPTAPASAGPAWGVLPKAPIGGRRGHAAVWTGREMVVWGGEADYGSDPLVDGAAFDPAARAWRMVPAAPLSPRTDAKGVWTGQEVVVFGGMSVDGDILADGAAWNPGTNRWRKLPSSPLGARDSAVVAWAGDRLVVWGGATVPPSDAPDASSEMRADGAAYVPATDRWVSVPAAPIPPRGQAESVWTGTRLVISGGYQEGDDDNRTDGAALDPVSGAWTAIADRPAPGSCGGDTSCIGVWTGAVALFPASGLAYDPAGNRWSAFAPAPAGAPAAGEPTVWTGRRLLAWGTSEAAGDENAVDDNGGGPPPAPTGAMYDPAGNRWQTFPAGPLSGRGLHSAIWTGQEMLVWGGTAGEASLGDGAAFRPAD